jgi:hypothetical protein
MNDCHCNECGTRITVAHAQGYGGFCSFPCAEKNQTNREIVSIYDLADCKTCQDGGWVQTGFAETGPCPDCTEPVCEVCDDRDCKCETCHTTEDECPCRAETCEHCHELVLGGRCKCDYYNQKIDEARGN